MRWRKNDREYVEALAKYFDHKRKEVLLAVRNKVYEKTFLQPQKSKYAGLYSVNYMKKYIYKSSLLPTLFSI
jgi:hypothetical protein